MNFPWIYETLSMNFPWNLTHFKNPAVKSCIFFREFGWSLVILQWKTQNSCKILELHQTVLLPKNKLLENKLCAASAVQHECHSLFLSWNQPKQQKFDLVLWKKLFFRSTARPWASQQQVQLTACFIVTSSCPVCVTLAVTYNPSSTAMQNVLNWIRDCNLRIPNPESQDLRQSNPGISGLQELINIVAYFFEC